jgi:glutathione S-transferase
MLKVWGRRSSFNLQKAMWLVGELGLPHEHIPAGGDFGLNDTPEFLAMNPHGRVPVIDDDGTVVWESQTILRYLAAKCGPGRFWSDDPGERSLAERWMDWSQASLQPDFLMGVFWGFYRTPEAQRNMPAVNARIRACTQHFQLLLARRRLRPTGQSGVERRRRHRAGIASRGDRSCGRPPDQMNSHPKSGESSNKKRSTSRIAIGHGR